MLVGLFVGKHLQGLEDLAETDLDDLFDFPPWSGLHVGRGV